MGIKNYEETKEVTPRDIHKDNQQEFEEIENQPEVEIQKQKSESQGSKSHKSKSIIEKYENGQIQTRSGQIT